MHEDGSECSAEGLAHVMVFERQSPPDSSAGPPAHIPALDGLRGLAVLLVVIFHIFQVESVPTQSLPRLLYLMTRLGQTGVDLFFVLSGFLITGILVDAKGKGSPRYFVNFYGRRTLRIFPLYYGVLVVSLILLPRLFGIVMPCGDPTWLWTYTANIPVAFGFDRGWFSHFWTLAIEEQFYMIWPAVVYFSGRKALIWACLGCIAGALVARVVAEIVGFSSFSFTPCRMDSLAVGALLALVVCGPGPVDARRKVAIGSLAATAIVMAPLYVLKTGEGDHWVQVVKFTPIAVFHGALLMVAVASPAGSPIGRLLGSAPLRSVGRLSYGIYVYQAFAIHLATTQLATGRLGPLGIGPVGALWLRVSSTLALTYAVSWISWTLYEKPFLRLKSFFEERPGRAPTPGQESGPVPTSGQAGLLAR